MTSANLLRCDGCGQLVGPAHLAKRSLRLEWATRYRPVHIQSLLVGGIAPTDDADYLYVETGPFAGEAAQILAAAEIDPEGKARETVLAEFQKRGLLLIHILDCPLEPENNAIGQRNLLENQLPATLARIRRSLKPKKVVLFSKELDPVVGKLTESVLGVPVWTHFGGPFTLCETDQRAFRRALAGSVAVQKGNP